MSAPQKFTDLATALAAYRAGTCRRWVEVDGWQIDLVQAAEPSKVARPGATDDTPICRFPMVDRATWDDIVARATAAWLDDGWRNGGDDPEHDRWVASNVRAELARVTAPVELPPLAEPALPSPPPVECCRACGRPIIGGR
jgi:hypothetical protein